MKAAFYTLGCKVNSYDTQEMMEILERNGYDIVPASEKADIFVINTCAVTNESERKSRQAVRRIKKNNPDAITVFTGCYVQTSFEAARSIESADIVCGTHQREHIIDYINEYLEKKSRIELLEEDTDSIMGPGITEYEGKNRAFIKIQDGCNMFCSYCIIPYARGRLKNAEPQSVLSQIESLHEKGYRECVITGIHIASYRAESGERLIDLLEKIDSQGKIERIRLGSLEPRMLTEKFLERLSKLDSVCDHFHISLQSGSDRILKLMNRHYTAHEYVEITERVRKYFPDAAITTDIIVGFPSEDESDYLQSEKTVERAGFSYVHVFPFSPKHGTPASEMKDQLTNAVKHERVGRLSRKMLEQRKTFLEKMLFTTQEILVEKKLSDNLYGGYTRNYIYTELESGTDLTDRIVTARITSVKGNGHLGGTPIEN